MAIIQDNIRMIMRDKNITQDEIIRRTRKVSTATLKNVLRDGWNGQRSTLEAIAEALEVEIWEIELPEEQQRAIHEHEKLTAEHEHHQEILRRLG